jgi:hypothetical protein
MVLVWGRCVWKRLPQTKGCSSKQERKEQLELLLPTVCGETWEGDEQEMFRLQDSLALIPIVSNETLTLIERMTLRVRAIFCLFSQTLHNVIPI